MATSSRALLIAFVAVISAFVGSTLWATRVASGIDADAVGRDIEQSRAGQAIIARRRLAEEARPRGDAAAEMAKKLVDYDARVAQEAAIRIESERARAERMAFGLDAVCVFLGIAAALLALRVVRQVHRVQQEHQQT